MLDRHVARGRSAAEGCGLECGADRRVSARGSEDHRRVTHAPCRARWPQRAGAAMTFALLLIHAALPAHASLPDDINALRLRGCAGSSAGNTPLHAARKLDEAARRVAGGAALPDAISAAGYSARSSAEIHVSGAGGERAAAELVAAHFCAQVTDPAAREMGIARSGEDTW